MSGALKKFEDLVIKSFIIIIAFIIFQSLLRLVVGIIDETINSEFFLFGPDQLLEIIGTILLILIGLELLESFKVYDSDERTKVEVILAIALIAIARKVITLDLKKTPSTTLGGIALIIISLSLGYFLIKKTHPEVESK
jgi:uncharacterized membrane protein (DUF373 family)